MSTVEKTSLSVDGPKPWYNRPKSISDYDGLAHLPHLSRLPNKFKGRIEVEPLNIQVEDAADGFVPGFLHMPPDFVSPAPETHHRTAAILLSGAGGGVAGPSSMYLSLGDKLAALGTGIPALRLDFRFPARNRYCVEDVSAAMAYLSDMYGLDRFVGRDERVVGCATVTSQTAETEGIRRLAPRPVLLLHGTGDRTLNPSCSERLYAFRNAQMAEGVLLDFIAKFAGLRVNDAEKLAVADQRLLDDGERTELMKRGGDLRPPESMD
ncbi:hypothetical protein DL763_001310 [Monosporascus cannonballus]|nr:hypothetical protein DL763_001310 [Monosporascus cannonballus]